MLPEFFFRARTIIPFHIIPMNTSGGQSPTGSEQIIGNSPGRGRAGMAGIRLATAEHQRVWQAFALAARGRANPFMAPTFGRRTAPWPILAGKAQRSINCVPLTDDILFSDGANIYSRVIEAKCEGTVAAGLTNLDIRMIKGSSPKAGHVFQAGEYAYPIRKVVSSVEDVDDWVYSVIVAMPLREAIAADTDLNFDDPRFRARLEEDGGLGVEMHGSKNGRPSISFVEDV
jgi:hypothetical protein